MMEGTPRRAPVVLQVLPALQGGGVERGTVEMAAAVVRAGGTALVASAGGRMAAQVERVGGRNILLPLDSKSPLAMWRNAARLARAIDQRTRVHHGSRVAAQAARQYIEQPPVVGAKHSRGPKYRGRCFAGKRLLIVESSHASNC